MHLIRFMDLFYTILMEVLFGIISLKSNIPRKGSFTCTSNVKAKCDGKCMKMPRGGRKEGRGEKSIFAPEERWNITIGISDVMKCLLVGQAMWGTDAGRDACAGLCRMESSYARTCRCVTAAASVQLSDALCIQIAFPPQVPNFQQPSLRLRRSPMHKMIDWPKVHTCQKFKPRPTFNKNLLHNAS